MSNLITLVSSFENLMSNAEKFEQFMSNAETIENMMERINLLEEEVKVLRGNTSESWVSLHKAAIEIGKTPSAIRQMIKNPKKRMAKGKVWKQEREGGSIYINLKEYRKAL